MGEEIGRFDPYVKVIFGTELLSRILSFNMALMVTTVFRKGSSNSILNAFSAMETMLFSLQPYESRKRYEEGVGKLHSEFKFTVVQNVFFNIYKDSFSIFRSSATVREEEGIRGQTGREAKASSANQQSKIARPAWLKLRYVNVDHISSAKGYLEKAKQSRKDKVRDTPTPADIGIHGALRVYRLSGAHLHQARDNVKYSFFQGLGYVMTQWNTVSTDVDQHAMSLTWASSDYEGINLDLEEVPCTEVCPFSTSASVATSSDAENKKRISSLFEDWPEMVITVEHDVHVVTGTGSQRRHSGGEKKTIRRMINLIEVACNFCLEYCRVRSIGVFMRTHKSALQCVMDIALLFKRLTEEFIDQSDLTCGKIADAEKVSVGDICLKDFMPGFHTKNILLDSKCLRMSTKEFEMFNNPPAWKKRIRMLRCLIISMAGEISRKVQLRAFVQFEMESTPRCWCSHYIHLPVQA